MSGNLPALPIRPINVFPQAMAMELQPRRMTDTTLEPWGGRDLAPAAVDELRAQCHGPLCGILRARGANHTEAEDVLADLWSDCLGHAGRPSLLEKFSGRTPLFNWLATVATHRWVDARRRQARLVPVEPEISESLDCVCGPDSTRLVERDETLARLLRESLRSAFSRCPPQALVLLRLVHMHGLSQREVGRMLGWGESKLSRYLTGAMSLLERDTLQEVRRRDPWLQLTWQDFVDLCQNEQEGFL